jgi:plasmid stabilization system protein ParE
MSGRELRFAQGASDDLTRLFEFLAAKDVPAAERALATIRKALSMICSFPYSCRKAAGSAALRECVIPFGERGYVAAFEIADDHVLVVAVRHQREDDYH